MQAIAAFRRLPEAESLAAANKRIANILRKSAEHSNAAVDAQKLVEPAERALHAALVALMPAVGDALAARRYDRALGQLATLRPTIDAFFADVMVNAEDVSLRNNRLALVAEIGRAHV